MFVVDTNILVYAADEHSTAHEVCRDRLSAWRTQADAWFLTWGIIYEFLRVTTHPRIPKKRWSVLQAWSFISALLESPGLEVLTPTERHPEIAAQVFEEFPRIDGNLVHDAHTAILMREHGVRRIYTRDADFHRFGFLEPIDPLARSLGEPRRRWNPRARRAEAVPRKREGVKRSTSLGKGTARPS